MEDNPSQSQKQKSQAKGKKNIEKGDDKLFLMGNINSNINVFSQLSSMYQSQEEEPSTTSTTVNPQSTKKPESKQDPVYSAFLQSQKEFDFEITKILNKLNKKSETTKLRALQELKNVLTERNEDFYKTFFATWLYIYKQMMTSEFDKKILEECNSILLIMAPKLKKGLAPFIKDLFPIWFMSMNDPNNEVALVATKAFEQTFPQNKYPNVLATCEDNFITHIDSTFRMTPEKVVEENKHLDETQSEEVSDRLILSCMASISAALKINAQTPDPSKFINKIISYFHLDQSLKGNSILLVFLHNKKRPRVRAGAVELINSLLSHIDTKIFQPNLADLTSTLLDALEDKDRSVQKALWKDCLIRVMKAAISDPASCQKIELRKYENKVLFAIKTAGSGLGALLFNRLVEFFSYLENFSKKNFDDTGAKIEDRITFYRKFFTSMTQAYGHEEVRFFGNDLTNSYFECALFCILKRILPLATQAKTSPPKNPEAALKTLKGFIREVLIVPCQEYVKKYSKTSALSPYKNIALRVGDTLGHIEVKPELQEDQLFSEFEREFQKLFEQNTKTTTELENFFSLLQGCVRIKQESVMYAYFQGLLSKCNQHFQEELRASFLSPEAVISDSLLEKKFEDMQKIEQFNAIFVADSTALKTNAIFPTIIASIFGNLVDLTKKFLECFDKIVKVSNVEKFAKFTMKPVSNILSLYDQVPGTGADKEGLESKLNELVACFSGYLNNGINLHNMILISSLLNPCFSENYFSDFVSFNNNKASEDVLLNKALESYMDKVRDEKAYHFSKTDNKATQDLILDFVAKTLQSDRYRMFAPAVCHVLLFSAQEKTIQEAIRVICAFLKELVTNKGKLSIGFDKLEPLFASVTLLVKARSLSTIEAGELEACYYNLIRILTSLYSGGGASRKRALVVYELLKKVNQPEKLKKDSGFKGLREYVIQSLHDWIFSQLETNLVKKDAKEKLKLENLVKMVEDYLGFLSQAGLSKHLMRFYEELLNERFFQSSMVAPDIWKVFMASYDATHGELKTNDIFQIKRDDKLDPKSYWLVIEMISVVNSNSLLLSPREKRFFTSLSNDFFIHELLLEMEKPIEENLQRVIEFLDFALTKSLEKSLIYVLGIKKLLKTYVANSKDLVLIGRIFESLLVKNLSVIASEISKPQLNTAGLFQRAIVHKNLLAVFEKFVPENQEKWAEAAKSFQDNILALMQKPHQHHYDYAQLTSFLINLDVYGSMVALNPKLMVEDKTLDHIINYIFKRIKVDDLKEGKLEPNFALNAIFELINLVIETKTFTPLANNILDIEKFFVFGLDYNDVPRNYSSSALIKINMFLRKVLSYFEIFSEGFKELAFHGILRTCKAKAQQVNQRDSNAYVDEELRLNNEINEIMFTEFAETIARMTIACDQTLNETQMYSLFDCSIPSIQKSAFILLKHFYENFALKPAINVSEEKLEEDKVYLNDLFANEEFVPVNMELVIKDYLQKEKELLEMEEDALEEEDEEDLGEKYLLNTKNHGFLLTWISLLLKLKLQISNSATEIENIYKRAFINYFNQQPGVYCSLMDIVFTWLKTLNFNLSQEKEALASKEYELGNLSLEWEDFASYEGLFRIILQFLYLFATRFPKFFRKWYDETVKANKKEVESLVKNFISNTLFNDEKNLIETKQFNWKTEEFNIFVMKSTRQILASYTKENSSLEISISVPDDYPLSVIQIECDKNVKIPPAKLTKYILMMRTILVNENDTFLSALMLWKSNIDKEFEGVEECAICYYVIHSSTRQLPRLACKTCKHKFHSVCIHKWFESSNKSECPLCKSQFW